MTAIRTSEEVTESVILTAPPIRIAEDIVESIILTAPPIRVATDITETIVLTAPPIRVATDITESVVLTAPPVRLVEDYIETIRLDVFKMMAGHLAFLWSPPTFPLTAGKLLYISNYALLPNMNVNHSSFVVANDLVARWKLDGNLLDSSPYHNTASANNNPSWVDGP